MQDALEAFMSGPDAQTFGHLRALFVASPGYRPIDFEFQGLEALESEGAHGRLLEAGRDLLAAALLSPALHYYIGRAAGGLGARDLERFHAYAYMTLRDALLATGDGTPTRPFLVTQVIDEFFILTALGHEPLEQARVRHTDGRSFDVLTDEQGGETWFDITDIVRRRGELGLADDAAES